MDASTLPPDGFALYTVILLRHQGEFLLLQRSPEKRFAPGRWTGVGGRVEAGEFGDLGAAALRELFEETGIVPDRLRNFRLRRSLFHDRPGGPLTGILYFTADLAERLQPRSDEGTLRWLPPDAFASLDIIETTAQVLPRLLQDLERDPDGREKVRIGIAPFLSDGSLGQLRWAHDGDDA